MTETTAERKAVAQARIEKARAVLTKTPDEIELERLEKQAEREEFRVACAEKYGVENVDFRIVWTGSTPVVMGRPPLLIWKAYQNANKEAYEPQAALVQGSVLEPTYAKVLEICNKEAATLMRSADAAVYLAGVRHELDEGK